MLTADMGGPLHCLVVVGEPLHEMELNSLAKHRLDGKAYRTVVAAAAVAAAEEATAAAAAAAAAPRAGAGAAEDDEGDDDEEDDASGEGTEYARILAKWTEWQAARGPTPTALPLPSVENVLAAKADRVAKALAAASLVVSDDEEPAEPAAAKQAAKQAAPAPVAPEAAEAAEEEAGEEEGEKIKDACGFLDAFDSEGESD
jgi:hypothetical protein